MEVTRKVDKTHTVSLHSHLYEVDPALVGQTVTLRYEILKELRLLTNYKMDSENRLCLLLVGHTELRRRIMISAQASLAQRIVLHCMLNGLDRDEVGDYIEHRLRLAGSDVRIFEEQAVEMVAMASKGLPRRIDRIAHYALHVEKATLELVA